MTKPTLSEHIEKIVEEFRKNYCRKHHRVETIVCGHLSEWVVEPWSADAIESLLRTHLTEIAKASEIGTLMAVREILHAIAMQTTSIEALGAIEKAQIAIVGDIVAANKSAPSPTK